MNLRCKSRAAAKALEQVSAHVGAGADVATLVQAVLARGSAAADAGADGEDDTPTLAKQAVVQLGYPAAVANAAIDRARDHGDAEADLPTVIKAVLRFCSYPSEHDAGATSSSERAFRRECRGVARTTRRRCSIERSELEQDLRRARWTVRPF